MDGVWRCRMAAGSVEWLRQGVGRARLMEKWRLRGIRVMVAAARWENRVG